MRTFCLFVFLLLSSNTFAQRTLEATVLDGMTRKPVGGAHVYLDGTSVGTTTDSLGKFKLTVRNAVNTSLVISHVVYEKMIIPEPFRGLPKVIYLEENITSFEDVVVSAKDISKRKRKEMLNVFRKQLLGYELGAQSCKIMNEDDVVLVHDKDNQELRAYAQKPIEIINNYLKYRVLWELVEFKINYVDKTLLDKSMQHVSVIGTVSFTDIGTSNESLRIRRRDVLRASTRHFFQMLAQGKMEVNESLQQPMDLSSFYLCEIFNDTIQLINPNKYFVRSKAPHDPSMNLVTIYPEAKDSITGDISVCVLDERTLNTTELVSRINYSTSEYRTKVGKEANKSGYIYPPPQESLSQYRMLTGYQVETKRLTTFPVGNYSKITFYTDTFLIDTYGNTNLYKDFLVENKMSRQRLGDLLPLDYEDIPLGGLQVLEDAPAIENESLLTVEHKIRTRFLRQLQAFPQEKIYVHTDKPCYMAGETVWFRVYLTDYATHSPTETESRYVYGELFNPVDSLIQRIKIRTDSLGIFKGYFDLPPNLASGDYRLRFYTRYMQESGEEYFFNRIISVGHTLSALYHTKATFSDVENSSKLHTILQFTLVKDGSPIVPISLRLVNASGKETFVPINGQGIAEFDILLERDLIKNLLNTEYEYNNMLHKQYLAIPPSRGEYHVSFYPEGGALPTDTRIRVAFKALQSSGLGEEVAGKVYNSTGDTVAVFTSNTLGMGSFSFVPRKGDKYTAVCRNNFGIEKRFHLPVENENAMNLKTEWNKGQLIIQVINSAGVSLPDSMRLLIHCRGVLFYNELWTAGKNISIHKERFPSGVLQLLLVDGKLNPVSERLVFNLNEQDVAKVSISTEKENYREREQIHTQINLTAYDSIPLQGSFSVSVTTDKDVQPDTTAHILSSLFLTSELKGYVESPAWYFTDGNISEIDHLMLTQGWSRYDISAVLKGNIRKPVRLPEVTSEISGQVASGLFLQNKGKNYYVIMSATGDRKNQDATIAGVVDGRFNLVYDEQPNGVSYNLQLAFPDNSIRAEMRLDTITYSPVGIRLPYRFNADRTAFDTYLKMQGLQYESIDGELVRNIDEVVISAKRIKGISPLSPGRKQDRIIPLEELSKKKRSAATLQQLLMSTPEVSIKRDGNGTLRARYKNGLYYYDYVFVVDGKWWPMYTTESTITKTERSALTGYVSDNEKKKTEVISNLDMILSIPTDQIEEIEIVKAPAPPIILEDFGNVVVNDFYQYGIKGNAFEHASTMHAFTTTHNQGYLGTILVTTKVRNGGIKSGKAKKNLRITPLGYQLRKEFYSPAYEMNEQQQEETSPDLRTTIYWNSDVRTNEDGKAEIEFCAADTATTYTVTIEGITNDGILVRKTEKIKRED